MKKCLFCNKELSDRECLTYFCSLKCKKEYYRDRNCLGCNKLFIPLFLKSKFCSAKCCNDYLHKKRHEESFKWKQERKCKICSKKFIPNNNVQVFCSFPCQYENMVGFPYKQISKKKCRVCKNQFIGGRKNKYCSVKCRRKFDYLKNKERKIRWNTEWGRRNKDKRKLYNKKWDSSHKDQRLFISKRHIHLKRTNGGSFTREEWNNVLLNQHGKCNDCGKRKILTIDHIVPVSKWKQWRLKHKVTYKCNDIENLQGLCRTCNYTKGNRIFFVAE